MIYFLKQLLKKSQNIVKICTILAVLIVVFLILLFGFLAGQFIAALVAIGGLAFFGAVGWLINKME